jgi:hypothetical protein
MMLLLVILLAWALGVALVAGLCLAARRGDAGLLALQAELGDAHARLAPPRGPVLPEAGAVQRARATRLPAEVAA